jgi:peptidylprolyl isomerase
MLRVWRAVPLIAVLVLAASCSSGEPAEGPDESTDPAAESDFSADIPRASGEPVPSVEGLPTVTLGADGAPTMTPAAGDPPTELVVQPLIAGSGEAVPEGAAVSVQYAGWLWDGTEFDSSWGRGGVPLDARLAPGELIEGWVQGLVGQNVGSQVMLIIPPELGYGDTDMGSIPPNSTLVFVVDILSAS